MDERVVAALRCPHPRCRDDDGGLSRHDRTLRCARGHHHDLARQGYVNLLAGRDPGTGDDADMVAARTAVLDGGRFDAVSQALADLVGRHLGDAGVIVDLGAGTGHHLAAVLDAVHDRVGVGVDLSRAAARRAARRHPRMGAVVADVWADVPVRDRAAAAVTCVFAPRNGPQIARILAPDGALVVVTPLPHHLGELREPLGLLEVDPRKEERLLATLDPAFVDSGTVRRVETLWSLGADEVTAVVGMGPTADHLDAAELDRRVATLDLPVSVRAAVELRVFLPRRGR